MSCLNRYKAELCQNLKCAPTARKKLMGSFEKMLRNFLEENETADWDALVEAFGTPAEMADTLLGEIPQEEIKRYKEHDRRKPLYIAIAILLTLLICVYVFFIKQKPLIQEDGYTIDWVVSNTQD